MLFKVLLGLVSSRYHCESNCEGKKAKIIEQSLETEDVAAETAAEEPFDTATQSDNLEEPKEEETKEENPKKKPGRPLKPDAIDQKEKITCQKCGRSYMRQNAKRHEQNCRGEP